MRERTNETTPPTSPSDWLKTTTRVEVAECDTG